MLPAEKRLLAVARSFPTKPTSLEIRGKGVKVNGRALQSPSSAPPFSSAAPNIRLLPIACRRHRRWPNWRGPLMMTGVWSTGQRAMVGQGLNDFPASIVRNAHEKTREQRHEDTVKDLTKYGAEGRGGWNRLVYVVHCEPMRRAEGEDVDGSSARAEAILIQSQSI